MLVAARTRGWLYDLFTHNYAEQLRIAREVQRRKLNLTQQDLPYPGSITGNTVNIVRQPAAAVPVAPPPVVPDVTPAPPGYDDFEVEQELIGGVWVEISRRKL